MKKSTKKVLKTAGIVGASAAATYFLIGNFFYYVTLTKKGLEKTLVPSEGFDIKFVNVEGIVKL